MNYRHSFHAGNFADVHKHALLTLLVRAMQRKDTGFLYLDTHAGRGAYDLSLASRGDSLARTPEHPEGVGRVANAVGLSPTLKEYWHQVQAFDRAKGGQGGADLRFYPGSPWLVRGLLRRQDRMLLAEKQLDEHDALSREFGHLRKVAVHLTDGYALVRAGLPPAEKRALVLIDPPYESQTEWSDIVTAVKEALRRLPSAVIALWFPLTDRARLEVLEGELRRLSLPPTWCAELAVWDEAASVKMKGSGLLVLNPPWQTGPLAEALTAELATLLGRSPGATSRFSWWVQER